MAFRAGYDCLTCSLDSSAGVRSSPGRNQMAEQIKTNRPYPIQLKLRDGRSATIRLMGPDDLDKIVDFAKGLPADDLLFLRTDITDRHVVKAWVDAIKN